MIHTVIRAVLLVVNLVILVLMAVMVFSNTGCHPYYTSVPMARNEQCPKQCPKQAKVYELETVPHVGP